MSNSNISLLREKFTIRDLGVDTPPVIALGNRLNLEMPAHKIPLVIRGHSMHMTLRYGAKILRHLSYNTRVENVETLLDWDELWGKLIKPFESENVPGTWIAVYYKGKIIYQSGYHHTFFDIIEQTEFKNISTEGEYDKSIVQAQNAFRKMGKNVMIEQESHVGFVLDITDKEKRFAIILRTPEQKATFIGRISASDQYKREPENYTCMYLASDYIEGINMAVRSGFQEANITKNKLSSYSEAGKEHKIIKKRMNALIANINQAEHKYKILYRPDKPDFTAIEKACFDAGL